MHGTRAERRRQQHLERKLDRAFKRLAKRDICSFCGEPFAHNTSTTFGLSNDEPVLACERCADAVEEVHGTGLVTARQYDFLSEARFKPEEIAEAVAVMKKAISYADVRLADAQKRSGSHRKRGINLLNHPWKEDDRAWFEQHPDRAQRVRAVYPGEDQHGHVIEKTPQGHQLIVLIRQVEPGLRMKNTFYLNEELWPVPEDEAIAHAMFDLAECGGPINNDELRALTRKYRAIQIV